jgi:CRP-like cAMP-binding protein
MSELLLQHIRQRADLTPQNEALVLSNFKKREIKKHEYLLRAGEICKYETFIVKGCLKAYTLDEHGTEHIAYFGVETWYVGDLYSFLTASPAKLYISALEDTEVLQIGKHTLDNLLIEVPAMERYFRLLFQNAFVASQERIMEGISFTAGQRYENFLQRYPSLDQRIPQYLIASYLGITPQFLSKIRRKKFST